MNFFFVHMEVLYTVDGFLIAYFCFRTIVATSGSDYKPFYHTLGISCVDLRYMYEKVAPPYRFLVCHWNFVAL